MVIDPETYLWLGLFITVWWGIIILSKKKARSLPPDIAFHIGKIHSNIDEMENLLNQIGIEGTGNSQNEKKNQGL